MSITKKRKLEIRNATVRDVDAILALTLKVYHNMAPYPKEAILGQISNYGEGTFVAILDGELVGYCAAIRTSESKALSQHTWKSITGNGFGATHDPNGDYLYGYEICVDSRVRGIRIGQRFYTERRKLCQHLKLKGIVFAGRLPGYRLKVKKYGSPESYVEAVKRKEIRDSVLSFQLRNNFEVIGILKNYLPADSDSKGYATHLLWKNHDIDENEPGSSKKQSRENTVRVGTVQYMQRKIDSFEEFERLVTYFVDVVADYRSDFIVFPELFSLQLLSIENLPSAPHLAIEHMTKYADKLQEMFLRLAVKFNVNIVAGSHPIKTARNTIQNVSFVFLRDGSVYQQPKIHPTPNEKYWWNIEGGDRLTAIPTDCGPIGVLICYDSEFPELGRHLANQGINILFVPFLTDERQSYLRVRYCAQARAVENQCYVVMSGNTGNLPNVNNMDIHYAQSCVLTPCDFGFSRDGIAADTTPNVEMVAFADLRMDTLREARARGTVQNLKDRRHDLYSVEWQNKEL